MSHWLGLSLRIVTLIVMLVGLFGLVVPIFPGVIVIWLAALGYGITAGFGSSGVWVFAALTVLMLAGVTIDNILMARGAHEGGAAWYSIALALLGGVAGTYFFPPLGGLVAAPVVLLAAEFARRKDWEHAWKATRGYLWGCGWAFVVRFGLGVVMIALWAAFWAW